VTHLIRREAAQAGYIPSHSYVPHEIFDADVMRKSQVQYPDSSPDLSEPPLEYECRDCKALLFEEELDDHDCADYGY
jgi:hypothetical protein